MASICLAFSSCLLHVFLVQLDRASAAQFVCGQVSTRSEKQLPHFLPRHLPSSARLNNLVIRQQCAADFLRLCVRHIWPGPSGNDWFTSLLSSPSNTFLSHFNLGAAQRATTAHKHTSADCRRTHTRSHTRTHIWAPTHTRSKLGAAGPPESSVFSLSTQKGGFFLFLRRFTRGFRWMETFFIFLALVLSHSTRLKGRATELYRQC